jgi:hypothetical protein
MVLDSKIKTHHLRNQIFEPFSNKKPLFGTSTFQKEVFKSVMKLFLSF